MWTIVLEALFAESPYACRKVITRIETTLNGVIPWLSLVLRACHGERQSLIDDDRRPKQMLVSRTATYIDQERFTFEGLR